MTLALRVKGAFTFGSFLRRGAAAMAAGAMTQSEPAIRIESLTKVYSGKGAETKLALDGVSFDVPSGQIFGLLGPNGAGKSTLINILAGLVTKTSGKAVVWGFDIDQHPRNAKRSIGVVPQEIIFDPFFTPRETLEIQAGLYGIPPSQRQTDALLAAMRLTDKAGAYSRTLSGGMKRRLLVAKAQEKSVVVTFDRDLERVPEAGCFDNVVLVDERTLEISYRKDRVNAGEVLAALSAEGLGIVDVSTRDPDLEDVFLSLVSEPNA